MSLDGKTVIVTGAARGIGQAIALKFAENKANLAICDLSAESCAESVAKCEAYGVTAKGYAMDVSKSDQVDSAVKAIHEDFGTIDSLVNNAGITRDGLYARMSDSDWDLVLDINLKGTFYCTRAVTQVMMKQRSGTIVNIASVIGLMGNPGQMNYAASKAGVIAVTKTAAREMAKRGIRCNAVAPGFIQTAMTDKLNEKQVQAMLDVIPLKCFGQPEDVADVVYFLASDQSKYVTGQTISICGGMVTA